MVALKKEPRADPHLPAELSAIWRRQTCITIRLYQDGQENIYYIDLVLFMWAIIFDGIVEIISFYTTGGE